jgi:hypothetical protein
MRKTLHQIAAGAVLALALAACGDPTPVATAVTDCNKIKTETIAFTAPDAQDVLETRSIGDTCKSAVVVMTVRRATGEPIWAFATPHPWLANTEGEGEAGAAAAMDAFLESWNAKIDTTASLPDWPQREQVFTEQLSAFERSPYDRDAYLELRGKGFPRLCYATGIESGECIYLDTATGVAFKVYESGV